MTSSKTEVRDEIDEIEEPKVLTVVDGAQATDLAKVQTWSREQVQLVKTTICKAADLTDDEARLFIAQAQRLGLDPIANQIHAVKRKGRLTIQIGIDGYRKIADRTGLYAGNQDPTFETRKVQAGQEGGVPIEGEIPVKATVTVEKLVAGQVCGFTASARWSEYCPEERDAFMWRKMPFTMLGKCAEALALRKAFPAELGGFYIPEEMDQAGGDQVRGNRTGQEDARAPNGAQRAAQAQEPASWAAARERGGPHALELPWGDAKGTPLGALSTDHLGRLLKWIRSTDRQKDFAANSGRLVLAIEEVLEDRRVHGDVDPTTGEIKNTDVEPGEPEADSAEDPGDPSGPPPREPGE